jgi:branched-chain amino acid transport system ATP-binding protein
MLEVENIYVYHGKVQVIKGVSFQVHEGETVFIIGPNGSGKTTCLNTICGIFHPSAGVIKFCGERIDAMKPHVIARKSIALVPQGRRLFPDQTVTDNLRLGYITRSRDRDFDRSVGAFFDLFPILKERRNQLAGTMSGGEQQMLAIGRALMAKPKLLLCDELSLGLAPLVVDAVFESLVKLQSFKTTMLIVEQFATKVFEIASRGYIMTLGEIILGGDTETMSQDEIVKKAYLTE